MSAELLIMFMMGLAGSVHCAGMCGPICISLTAVSKSPFEKAISILIYHSGRTLSYVMLGLIIFLIGQQSGINQFQNILSILTGALILLFLFLQHYWNIIESALSKIFVYKKVIRELGTVLMKPGLLNRFLSGVLNGLLPCGLVYIALLNSFRQQEWLGSVLSVMAFGLGTFPVMIMISWGAGWLKNSKLYQTSRTGITTTIAVLFILRGLNLGIPYISPDMSSSSKTVNHGDSCCEE